MIAKCLILKLPNPLTVRLNLVAKVHEYAISGLGMSPVSISATRPMHGRCDFARHMAMQFQAPVQAELQN